MYYHYSWYVFLRCTWLIKDVNLHTSQVHRCQGNVLHRLLDCSQTFRANRVTYCALLWLFMKRILETSRDLQIELDCDYESTHIHLRWALLHFVRVLIARNKTGRFETIFLNVSNLRVLFRKMKALKKCNRNSFICVWGWNLRSAWICKFEFVLSYAWLPAVRYF